MRYKFGLIAKDIKHSISPLVYQTLGEKMGISVSYDIFNVPEDALAHTVAHCREALDGFNVTMPYKQAILPFMDELDESAQACGSTNTVLVKSGRLTAFNTDGWGTMRALAMEGFHPRDMHVVMLGAGGVAFSIAYNLKLHKAGRVDVVNIIPEQTKALCGKFGPGFHPHEFGYGTLAGCCKGADLFINASVMGQIGYDEFMDFGFLSGLARNAIVYDVNYSNPDARLVPAARAAGYRAYTGKSMTACQGVRVMEIWTGLAAGEDDIRDLVDKICV